MDDTTQATPAKKPKAKKSAKPATAKPLATKPKKAKRGITPVVLYSQQIADEICVRTAMGQSLRTIAADKTMPS